MAETTLVNLLRHSMLTAINSIDETLSRCVVVMMERGVHGDLPFACCFTPDSSVTLCYCTQAFTNRNHFDTVLRILST